MRAVDDPGLHQDGHTGSPAETAPRGGLRGLCRPSTLTGGLTELAWVGAHVLMYPMGTRTAVLRPDARNRPGNQPPAVRALFAADPLAARIPVLLVHGLVDNRSVFSVMSRSLRRRGFAHVGTWNYSPLLTDVAGGAADLGAHIERICEQTGHDQVHVVGHSLGGLISRYYVQRQGGDRRVASLVTLGTPHSGSLWAHVVPTPLIRQLRPGLAGSAGAGRAGAGLPHAHHRRVQRPGPDGGAHDLRALRPPRPARPATCSSAASGTCPCPGTVAWSTRSRRRWPACARPPSARRRAPPSPDDGPLPPRRGSGPRRRPRTVRPIRPARPTTRAAVLGRVLTHRYGPITAPVTTGGRRSTGRPVPPSLPRRSRLAAPRREALDREGAPCLAAVHRRSSSAPGSNGASRRRPARPSATPTRLEVRRRRDASSPGSPPPGPPPARPPGAALVRRARRRCAARRRAQRVRRPGRPPRRSPRTTAWAPPPQLGLTGEIDDAGARRSITEAEAQARLGELAASRAARAPKTVLPTQGRLTTCYCMRWGQMHWGIDLAAPLGTPIYAATDGVVLRAGPASGFGNAVYIQDADGNVHIYGHMRYYSVRAGDVVTPATRSPRSATRASRPAPTCTTRSTAAACRAGRSTPQNWLAEHGVEI